MNDAWNITAAVSGALLVTPVWTRLIQRATNSPEIPQLTGIVAVLLPLFAGAIGWRFADDPTLPAWWWAAMHTVPLAIVDVREHRLPRWWVVSLAGGGLCLLTAVAAVVDEPHRLFRAVLAGAGAWLAMRVVEWCAAGRMGGGDTRLHAALALYTAWMSWQTVLFGFVAGSLLLGGTAGFAVLWQRRSWSSRIAAGPSLVAGAWLALVLTGP